MSVRDISEEFINIGFNEVKQLLVKGSSDKYYVVDNDNRIRALQLLISSQFKVIEFFVVDRDDLELTVFTLNII